MRLKRRDLRRLIAEAINEGKLSTQEELMKTANWYRDVVIPSITEDPDNYSFTADRDYYVWGNRNTPYIYIPKGTQWGNSKTGSGANSHVFGNSLRDSGETKNMYTLGDAYWMLNDANRDLNLRLPLQSFETSKNLGQKNSSSVEQLSREIGIAHAGVEKIKDEFASSKDAERYAPPGFR